jgi:hypothetical protein
LLNADGAETKNVLIKFKMKQKHLQDVFHFLIKIEFHEIVFIVEMNEKVLLFLGGLIKKINYK